MTYFFNPSYPLRAVKAVHLILRNRSRFRGSKFKVKLIYHENTCAIAPMSFPRKRESREPRNFWILGQARNDGIFMIGG